MRRQDGQQHSKIEVIASRVIFLERRGAPISEEKMDDKVDESHVAELEPEDLPF